RTPTPGVHWSASRRSRFRCRRSCPSTGPSLGWRSRTKGRQRDGRYQAWHGDRQRHPHPLCRGGGWPPGGGVPRLAGSLVLVAASDTGAGRGGISRRRTGHAWVRAQFSTRRYRAYTITHLIGDMVGLVGALKAQTAVIVGHDWGAPVAWYSALLR